MVLYVHVYEELPDEDGFLSYVLSAKFASVLDALDFYEFRKKHHRDAKLLLIDTFHHQQVDVAA